MWGQRQAVMGPRTLSEAGESRAGRLVRWGARPLLFSVPSLTQPQEEGRGGRGQWAGRRSPSWFQAQGDAIVCFSISGHRHVLKLSQPRPCAGPRRPHPCRPHEVPTAGRAGHSQVPTLGGPGRSARRCCPGGEGLWATLLGAGQRRGRHGPHTGGDCGPEAVTAHGQRIGTEEPGQRRPLAQRSA